MTTRIESSDPAQRSIFDVPIDRPATGKERKTKALDEHEIHKKEAIVWLRKQLKQLWIDRAAPSAFRAEHAFVTADDARRIYDASTFPPEYSVNRTFFGSIFRGRDWEGIGRQPSEFPRNNARSIMRWRYVGE